MKYLIALALTVISLAAVIGISVFQSEQNERKYLTAETQAQIIEMSPRKTIDPETGQTNRVLNVLVIYRYSIAGKVFEKQTTLGKSESLAFQVNQPAKVCFNPNRPEQSALFPSEFKCGD